MLRTLLAHADEDPQTAQLAARRRPRVRLAVAAAVPARGAARPRPRPPGDRRRRRRPRGARSGRRAAGVARAAHRPLLPEPRRHLRVAPGAAAAPGRPADRRARRAARRRRRPSRRRSSSSARSRCPRRSPTRRCARTASRLRTGELLDLDETARDLVAAGYERVDQVEDRGQFAIRGGLLDVFPATEDRAVRVDLFGDEIESLRWFSTFTQRSLGRRRASSRSRRPPSSPRSTASWPRSPRSRTRPTAPDIAELLPVEDFHPFLELAPAERRDPDRRRGGRRAGARRPLAGRERRLPRPGRPPPVRRPGRDRRRRSTQRARIRLSSIDQDQPFSFRAQAADIQARGLKEAEPELEKLARSGYRTVVAFARRGEGERAAYNLGPAQGRAGSTPATTAPAPDGRAHVRPRAARSRASSRRSSTSR